MISLGRSPCDEGVLRAAAPDTQGCADRAKPWVLAATILASSMVFIDGSVVNVALPAIQADLNASVRTAQWVVNAYMLFLGALILVGGAAGDRFGRRRIFVFGILIFTLASIVCGLAPNASVLIAARAAHGVGAALLVPSSLAIISASFPESERGKAIGTWAGFSALTTALGPIFGGWLVDVWSWRGIFFINVPVALCVVGLSYWRVPESRETGDRTGVDWLGGALVTVALGGVAYGLTAASERGWTDPVVIGLLLAGCALFAIFVWHQAASTAPMVPLGLFRSKTFSGANAMTLMLYFGLSGALFFVPFNLIKLQGYSATLAGAAFLPFTLIMGGLSRWSGGLIDRYGARTPLIVGPIIAAGGFAMLAIPGIGGSYWTTFFPDMVVLGLGMAISVAPLTTTVMGAVPSDRAGTASGVNNAVSRVAGMLAVALLVAVAVNLFSAALEARLDTLEASAEVRRALEAEVPNLAEATVPESVQGSQRAQLQAALDHAFLDSFRGAVLIAAAAALLSALVAALTIKTPAASHDA